MTPNEHATKAEELLGLAETQIMDRDVNLARAQVHATLSLRQPEVSLSFTPTDDVILGEEFDQPPADT